jgi:hypothetical protein
MYILAFIKKFMSMKPNPKEINIILNIVRGAQFEFLPRAPFYIDTPLPFCNENFVGFEVLTVVVTTSSVFWDITSSSPLKLN